MQCAVLVLAHVGCQLAPGQCRHSGAGDMPAGAYYADSRHGCDSTLRSGIMFLTLE